MCPNILYSGFDFQNCVITVRNEVSKVMFLQVSVCPQGGAWSWGGGCLVQGGLVSQHALRQTTPPPPPRDGYCCGWYASYSNAFLFREINAQPNLARIQCNIATHWVYHKRLNVHGISTLYLIKISFIFIYSPVQITSIA